MPPSRTGKLSVITCAAKEPWNSASSTNTELLFALLNGISTPLAKTACTSIA